ncbi:MAG: hypothetical protein HQL82_13115 [Magnetococcales bacterium]|nr:hypothetical protein [Magnetococcales bacterium]
MGSDDTIIGDGSWKRQNQDAWVNQAQVAKDKDKPKSKPKDKPKAAAEPAAREPARPPATGMAKALLLSMGLSLLILGAVLFGAYQGAKDKSGFGRTLDRWKQTVGGESPAGESP